MLPRCGSESGNAPEVPEHPPNSQSDRAPTSSHRLNAVPTEFPFVNSFSKRNASGNSDLKTEGNETKP
jgi:hypothetical protein